MRRLADLVVRWPWAVIGVWVAIAVALPLTFPSLNEMAQRHPLAILPSDAPSSVAARQMTEAFHESGSDNLLVVAFINETGLKPADEATYRKVVDALRDDVTDVVMVQDFFTTPQLRPFLTSKDKTTWVLPVGLAGELGTPRAYEAYNRVADLVKHNVAADGPLTVHVTGPAATVADLTVAGEQDRMPIEIAIGVLVLLVLLVVYRNPVTMLLPLAAIGTSLVTAQAVVAGVSELFGLGVSNQSVILLSAMIAGAGTDYAVFLISRYHDYLRQGADLDDAVRRALISIGKVITASAATVGITFLGISFAQMGVFSTVGVACAIGVGVAFLAAMTLLPAILVLAGPRGWVKPRRELTARFWRRSGIRIVRRPKAHLVGSLLVLVHSRQLREPWCTTTTTIARPSDPRPRVRSGMPRWNAISPSVRPCPNTSSFSHRATCAHRRPSRTWSRWHSGSANCRTSVLSAASPDPPELCRRSSEPPIRRALSVIGWPPARP